VGGRKPPIGELIRLTYQPSFRPFQFHPLVAKGVMIIIKSAILDLTLYTGFARIKA